MPTAFMNVLTVTRNSLLPDVSIPTSFSLQDYELSMLLCCFPYYFSSDSIPCPIVNS
jgi:hypothetical protein